MNVKTHIQDLFEPNVDCVCAFVCVCVCVCMCVMYDGFMMHHIYYVWA